MCMKIGPCKESRSETPLVQRKVSKTKPNPMVCTSETDKKRKPRKDRKVRLFTVLKQGQTNSYRKFCCKAVDIVESLRESWCRTNRQAFRTKHELP